MEVIGISTDPKRELVKYPNGDEVQYFTVEFYANNWQGELKIENGNKVKKLEFRSKNFIEELPENEREILKSLKYYQKEKKIMLK